MTASHATVAVAASHIEAQGVSAAGCDGALAALFCPALAHDGGALERYLILASELTQLALNTLSTGSPQTLTFGLVMLEIQFVAMREMAEKFGVAL